MSFDPEYHESPLTRDEVDQMSGPVVIEFGANWCPICQGFSPEVEQQLRSHSSVQHIRIADGKGKLLGRSFAVKLWPSFVFLRDGQVIGQVSRPSTEQLQSGLASLLDA